MQTCVVNIKDLMESGARFQIPCYQRRYCWTNDDCDVLLNDIKELVKEHSKTENMAPHFMGSIVVQKDQTGTVWQIIDGQQRLVTMNLFYQALAQITKEYEADGQALADKVSKVLGSESKFIFPKPNEKSKYKINKKDARDVYADTDAFAAIYNGKIFPESKEGEEDEVISKHHMVSNYRWFYAQLTKFDYSDLTNLFDVTKYLEVAEISLENNDKPQFIFESLNAKGKPLEEWDKIRNLILMEIPSSDLEDCYQTYWLQIERSTESDVWFVYYYYAAKDAISLSSWCRYSLFRQRVMEWRDAKEKLLKSMYDYAIPYGYIKHPQDLSCLSNEQEDVSSSLKFKIEQLLQLRKSNSSLWYWIPFGMQCLMMHRDGKISSKELLDVLQVLDIYLVRTFVGNFKQRQTGSWGFDGTREWHHEAVFLSLCDKFKSLDPGKDFVGTVTNYLCNFDHWEGSVATDWGDMPNADEFSMPKDSVFAKTLKECPFYALTPASLRPCLMYIIARLEMTYDKEKTDISKIVVKSSGDDRTTIEHIMPQTLNKVWKDDLGGGEKAYEIHETWLDRLANLTLLSQSDNSRVSNKSFEAKCPYYEDSGLSLNQEIASHASWRTRQFNQRTDLLVDLALKTWPYPKL